MAQDESRSVRKTKRILQQCFAALLREKPIQKISVREICERAELSRSSFYAHYKDIYDLQEQMEQEIVRSFEQMCSEIAEMPFPHNVRHNLRRFFTLLFENQQTAKTFLGMRGNSRFVLRLNAIVGDAFYDALREYRKENMIRRYPYYYAFISEGLVGMVRLWLEQPQAMTIEEMVEFSYSMILRLIVFAESDISLPAEPQ